MRVSFLSSALLLSTLAFSAQAQQTQPDLTSAQLLAQQLFERSGSTGMVVLVVRVDPARGDQLWFHGFGETAPSSHQPPTPDSLLRLCSLTKIFTTDLLDKLILDNKLRLDSQLQQFAPEGVAVPSRGGRPITLGDLATHTAGLPRELGPAPAGTPHFTFPDEATRWQWLPSSTLRTAPGTAAAYSNIGFDLLGDALAAAAHQPYPRLLATRTLAPLNMRDTTFSPDPSQCARLLQTAHDEGPCTSTEQSAGSSGLYSTARDIAQWLRYLLGTGAVAQNPAAQAVYLQPGQLLRIQGLEHAGEPTGIGLGWVHLLTPGSEEEIVQKTGGGAGFLTYIAINHARHTAIFLAATEGLHGDPRFHLFREANNLLLAEAGLPLLPPEPERPAVTRKSRTARSTSRQAPKRAAAKRRPPSSR